MPARPVELADGRLGAGHTVVGEGGEHAQLVELENFEADVGLGEFLSHDRVVPAAVGFGKGEEILELPTERDLLTEGRCASFERKRAHGDLPAVADTTDECPRRTRHRRRRSR